MKVKASALYLVIVIALVMGVICAALIATAYFYQSQYQRQLRYQQLESNLNSGISFLLAAQLEPDQEKTFSLFGNGHDSVSLKKINWGLFDIGTTRAFIQSDTVAQALSMAHLIDSAKWAALYIIDEDRSLSVSGQTLINGDAFLPKAGVKEAYVDNQAYQGDPRMVTGHRYHSEKKMPPLQSQRLQAIRQYFKMNAPYDSLLLKQDSVWQSFFKAARFLSFQKKVFTLRDIRLGGHIVICSDTTLTIDSTAHLNGILVFAPVIVVKSGFRGNCQLFATDSLYIGPRCVFSYPSCAGVIRQPGTKGQLKLSLGNSCRFTGTLFTYDPDHSTLAPFTDLGKQAVVSGQVYSQGMTGLNGQARVNGSLFTERFIYQSAYTRYENYLINTRLDQKALSAYYLTSDLLPVAQGRQKVLQWLGKK